MESQHDDLIPCTAESSTNKKDDISILRLFHHLNLLDEDNGGNDGNCCRGEMDVKNDGCCCNLPQTEWTERRHQLLLLSRPSSHPSSIFPTLCSYSGVPSVLTTNECECAMNAMWLFLNYTTFGRIQRDDPRTWFELKRYNKSTIHDVDRHDDDEIPQLLNNNNSNSDNDDDFLFRTNGAGYLLSTIHELLADRVFTQLFGTKELHTSKEGFYFHPFPSNGNHNVEEVLLYRQPQEMNHNGNSIAATTPLLPFIRSMVAFTDVELLLRWNTSINDDILLSTSSSSSIPVQSILLQKGDVFLWRTDGMIASIHAIPKVTTNLMSILYCTMQPATCTPETTLSMKVESYRQRQTTTYRLDIEEWMPPYPKKSMRPSTAATNNNYESATTIIRQYYDTGPPLMTMRLAELYGLVPYHHDNSVDSNHQRRDDHRQQRAIIRGVQFYDDNIIQSQRYLTPPWPSSNPPNDNAHLVHLTTDDPKEMMGQEKYLGGMASACQQYVYGVPGGARRVLRIRVSDGSMDCIGPSYDGKFKWLRGVTVSPSVMQHDPKYPSGCCLALPCNTASVLKINPYTDDVYTFGEDVLKDCGSDRWHYHGGNVAVCNGWLYAIPANANRVVKINPITDEIVYIGPTFHSGGQKWFGGITGTDGCIYGIPHNETSVLKIDPTNDSITLMRLDDNQPLPTGQWKWHGGLRAGDKIYGFPNNADNVLVIDCRNSRIYTIDSMILESGRHRIPQDHCYKYLGGATTRDERYAYLFPCDAERVLRIDCMTDELCHVGPHLLDGANKFQNGFVGRDGCVYGIPQRAIGVLRITPHTLRSSSPSPSLYQSTSVDRTDGTEDVVELMDCGPDMIGVKDKFEGGVLGPDGCIYCIPLRAKTCIKIVPGKAI